MNPTQQFVAALERLADGPTGWQLPRDALLTGIPTIDATVRFLRPGTLTVLAARPAMGTSAFAQNIILEAALNAHAPVSIAATDPSLYLAKRFLRIMTGLDKRALAADELDVQQRRMLRRASTAISRAQITVVPLWGRCLKGIVDGSHLGGKEPGLLVIDRVECLNDAESFSLGTDLKLLAHELGIAVLALTVVDPMADDRDDNHPRNGDIRRCRPVVDAADTVITLYREDYYNEAIGNTRQTELTFLRQTDGPVQTFLLRFDREALRFREPGPMS